MLIKYLSDLAQLVSRRDISRIEKYRIACAFLAAKIVPGGRTLFRFLGYSIASNLDSRGNCRAIVREVFLLGDYAFKSKTPVRTIFDVGANIGVASLFFHRYFPDASITAFEAMPKNFAMLEENMRLNKVKNIQLVSGFLGNERGTRAVYYLPKRPGGSTGIEAVAAEKRKRNDMEKVDVPALKLSDYIQHEVDFLKMDVEGAEGEILRELDESRKLSRIKQMAFEYHVNPDNHSNALADILDILERNGFSTVIYDNENGAYGKSLEPHPMYHFMIRAFGKEERPR